jgi:hypothetical protein
LFIVGSAIESAAHSFLLDATPLLEEEGNPCGRTLITQRRNPRSLHRPGTGSTFAAYDYPVNTRKVYFPQVFQEWFYREKADGCWCGTQVHDSWQSILPILDAHAPPDMR